MRLKFFPVLRITCFQLGSSLDTLPISIPMVMFGCRTVTSWAAA